MPQIRTAVLGSSVRPKRMLDRVLKWVRNRLEDREHEVEFIDPLVWDLPILRQPLRFYSDPSEAPQELCDLTAIIDRSDLVIVLTTEYNRTLPPALTNLLDHLPQITFSMKPAGIVSYSTGHGALLAASQARQLLCEMGCLVVPHITTISHVQEQLTEHGSTENQSIIQDFDLQVDQCEFVLKAKRSLIKETPNIEIPKPHPYS